MCREMCISKPFRSLFRIECRDISSAGKTERFEETLSGNITSLKIMGTKSPTDMKL